MLPMPSHPRRRVATGALASAIGLLLVAPAARAQSTTLPKSYQILIAQGLQVQGMVTNYDPFHLSTYQAANYTSVNWVWDSNTAAQGPAPGSIPWARWKSGAPNRSAPGSAPSSAVVRWTRS